MRPTYVLSLALILLFPLVAPATTIHIPSYWPTIQQGIEAARTGDIVLVAPGTYRENINFLGKAIEVRGAQGSTCTVIDGGQITSVVTFENFEHRDSILTGFTLTNGAGTLKTFGGRKYIYGAGIYCYCASPTISDNRIYRNIIEDSGQAFDYVGGGIYCQGQAYPRIMNNVIETNQANSGGAIYCYTHEAPTKAEIELIIMGNSLIANRVVDYHSPSGLLACQGGGAIVCKGTGEKILIEDNRIGYNAAQGNRSGIRIHQRNQVTIRNNHIFYNSGKAIACSHVHSVRILENHITDTQDGHAIYCYNSWPSINIRNNRIARSRGGSGIWLEVSKAKISGNTITENTNTYGAGIRLAGDSKVMNNFIAFNTATSEKQGGSIWMGKDNRSTIVNNTLVGNSSAVGGGAISAPDAQSKIINTICWNNHAPGGVEIYGEDCLVEYCNVMGGYSGTGNIDSDPLFVDPAAGDLHLRAISPCRDAGNNNAPHLNDWDVDGDPRFEDGIVDMGADEIHLHLYCMGEAFPNQMIDLNLIGPPTLNAVLLLGADLRDSPMPTVFGDWYIAPPYTVFPIGTMPGSGVFSTKMRIPPGCPVPMLFPLQGMVRDSLTNLCVIEVEEDYHPPVER